MLSRAAATPAMTATAIDAGAAWYEERDDRGGDGVGAVCSVFRHASYIRFEHGVVALCDGSVAPGPLHLRVRALPPVAAGDRVVVRERSVEIGRVTIMVPPGRHWAPPPIDRDALDAALRLRRRRDRPAVGDDGPRAATMAGVGSLLGDAPATDGAFSNRRVETLADLVACRDLVALARTVGGRGPGLTPAGDDLLAGVLVADALRDPERVAERRAAALTAVTTDVAAAFLRWAAAGQCIQPVHDVVSAVACDEPVAEAAARAELRAIGASSGVALLLGLDLALTAA